MFYDFTSELLYIYVESSNSNSNYIFFKISNEYKIIFNHIISYLKTKGYILKRDRCLVNVRLGTTLDYDKDYILDWVDSIDTNKHVKIVEFKFTYSL